MILDFSLGALDALESSIDYLDGKLVENPDNASSFLGIFRISPEKEVFDNLKDKVLEYVIHRKKDTPIKSMSFILLDFEKTNILETTISCVGHLIQWILGSFGLPLLPFDWLHEEIPNLEKLETIPSEQKTKLAAKAGDDIIYEICESHSHIASQTSLITQLVLTSCKFFALLKSISINPDISMDAYNLYVCLVIPLSATRKSKGPEIESQYRTMQIFAKDRIRQRSQGKRILLRFEYLIILGRRINSLLCKNNHLAQDITRLLEKVTITPKTRTKSIARRVAARISSPFTGIDEGTEIHLREKEMKEFKKDAVKKLSEVRNNSPGNLGTLNSETYTAPLGSLPMSEILRTESLGAKKNQQRKRLSELANDKGFSLNNSGASSSTEQHEQQNREIKNEKEDEKLSSPLQFIRRLSLGSRIPSRANMTAAEIEEEMLFFQNKRPPALKLGTLSAGHSTKTGAQKRRKSTSGIITTTVSSTSIGLVDIGKANSVNRPNDIKRVISSKQDKEDSSSLPSLNLLVRAKYSFAKRNNNQLTINAGEILIAKKIYADGWTKVIKQKVDCIDEDGGSEIGLVPSAYLEDYINNNNEAALQEKEEEAEDKKIGVQKMKPISKQLEYKTNTIPLSQYQQKRDSTLSAASTEKINNLTPVELKRISSNGKEVFVTSMTPKSSHSGNSFNNNNSEERPWSGSIQRNLSESAKQMYHHSLEIMDDDAKNKEKKNEGIRTKSR